VLTLRNFAANKKKVADIIPNTAAIPQSSDPEKDPLTWKIPKEVINVPKETRNEATLKIVASKVLSGVTFT
jgi:hypothetical protein